MPLRTPASSRVRSILARRRVALATMLVALGLLLASASYAEARGAPRWLARWLRAVSGRSASLAPVAAPGDTVELFGPKTMALGTATSATFVERFTVPGPPTSTMATASSVQRATAPQTVAYYLPKSSYLQGTSLRRFCERDLQVGDTISAHLGPQDFIDIPKKARWPRELLLVLRRTARKPGVPGPEITFEIYAAKVDGVRRSDVRGIFAVEPESAWSDLTHNDDGCYTAVVFGQLTRELRSR